MAAKETPSKIDLQDILQDVFTVLTEKERQIITQRFSLDNKPRRTLEEIGKEFNVTRERIRQIEKIALGKLHRTASNTKLREINALAESFLKQAGGALTEKDLISQILNEIGSEAKVDGYIIRLALQIDNELKRIKHSDTMRDGWRLKNVSMENVNMAINHAISLLKKKKDVLSEARLTNDTLAFFTRKGIQVSPNFVKNCFTLHKDLKKVDNGWGLMNWRHINPRSIRDKALIILQEEKKPLHFVTLANKIIDAEFNKKIVTVQAVHNELIRYDDFVLVGRGIYALREWGYSDGTVADVIEELLAEAKGPMTKQEIIDGVLSRRKVKLGTISLNLQKNDHFVRVGRAVYQLDPSKKPKS